MKYPELIIDWHRNPLLADNIWHAQRAGHPKVLTYNGSDTALRNAAMRYEHKGSTYEIPTIQSKVLQRDEYPFACTKEGGGGAWIGHIPSKQNSAQGGLISGFRKRHSIVAGRGEQSKFIVKVINHPCDPVTK